MDLLRKVVENQLRTDMPAFQVGDNVRVDVKIKEKDSKGNEKTRIQAFEGLVMSIQGSGIGRNFIVRKVSSSVGVERTFPINSPVIDKVVVVRKGSVHQAKLGFIRNLRKTPKIKERN